MPTALAQQAISLLRPQSRASLSTPSGPPAWADAVYDGRRAYWLSLDDQAIPSAAQEGMLLRSAVRWDIKRYPSGHSPFLSYPEALSAWMAQVVDSWQKPVGSNQVLEGVNSTALHEPTEVS